MLFLSRRMTQLVSHSRYVFTTATSYEDVIQALNTLQTNAEYLRTTTTNHSSGSKSLHAVKKYLLRSGLTLEDVDKLSVIHVSGTKGKGSTCAFAEVILRNYGFKTGFYSSPHLIHVTERIRINGRPIKEDIFTKYFWHVYNKLNNRKENDSDMPTYFKFLTILMFHIFLNADIDVVILEVGIGGEYDCTNIVRHPVCVGITSLGLEHTSLLGHTMEEIAAQKSGIFKENTIAFTIPQPDNAMNVIRQKAVERNCRLYVVPDFKSYKWNGDPPILGIPTNVQEQNASLAIQLAHTWMSETAKTHTTHTNSHISNRENEYKTRPLKENGVAIGSRIENTSVLRSQYNVNNDIRDSQNDGESVYLESQSYAIPATSNKLLKNEDNLNARNVSPAISFAKTAFALSSCTWPGRAQLLRGSNMDFYLDGAHTCESIQVCASWYLSKVAKNAQNRYLVFNLTGDRDVDKLLKPLRCLQFEKACFVPNVSGKRLKLDQLELKTTSRQQQDRCRKHSDIWGEDNAVVLNSVSEALDYINRNNNSIENLGTGSNRPQVLITGSLHLVGAALLLLDPNLTMKTDF